MTARAPTPAPPSDDEARRQRALDGFTARDSALAAEAARAKEERP